MAERESRRKVTVKKVKTTGYDWEIFKQEKVLRFWGQFRNRKDTEAVAMNKKMNEEDV